MRITMMYKLEYWEIDRKIDQCMSVAEMERWTSGVIREDKMRK